MVAKLYAVKKGYKTGIFDNWADCQAAINGYSSPEFKSFATQEDAEAFLDDRAVYAHDKMNVAVDGNDWLSIKQFKQSDWDRIPSLVKEANENVSTKTITDPSRIIHKFTLDDCKLTATRFRTGTLLVQGKNNALFQLVMTCIYGLLGKEAEHATGDTKSNGHYQSNSLFDHLECVDTKKTDTSAEKLCPVFPDKYPQYIKLLVRQAVGNLECSNQCEDDYSQYAFPALKALEGHIRYLITLAGGNVEKQFDCFKKKQNRYVLARPFSDRRRNNSIEKCYNYYKSQRDTLFHAGVDKTRLINTKTEADKIIRQCIALIASEQ